MRTARISFVGLFLILVAALSFSGGCGAKSQEAGVDQGKLEESAKPDAVSSTESLPQVKITLPPEESVPDAAMAAPDRTYTPDRTSTPDRTATPDATVAAPAPAFQPRMMPLPRPSGAEPEAARTTETRPQNPITRNLPMVAKGATSSTSTGALTEKTSADGKFQVVKVFYGTDRSVAGVSEPGKTAVAWHWITVGSATITFILLMVACCLARGRLVVGLVASGVLVTVLLGAWTLYLRSQMPSEHIQARRVYGNDRGEFEMGYCEVSIPKDHRIGELEAPSVLRLEFREDPEQHVVLLDVQPEEPETFFADLQKCVGRSKRKEAFVFVHGYNVTFDNAARRTAQLAHDLKFDGAPIFFSWPSAGGLLQYAVDETNVVWSVPHLKEFLLGVAKKSGAENVHLIAHSMGNRALTSALERLSYELRDEARLFREVILTAPDIDAEVFRRDLAPAITRTADRVTLYASSNDEALAASKQFHGYPRAGDTGGNLVVVPGIDTVDVSAVDTSLLGHSYYGDNDTVLADLFELLQEAKPPQSRSGLHLMRLGQLRYWVFLRDRLGLAPRSEPR